MVFKNGVTSIQIAGYNGAHTVYLNTEEYTAWHAHFLISNNGFDLLSSLKPDFHICLHTSEVCWDSIKTPCTACLLQYISAWFALVTQHSYSGEYRPLWNEWSIHTRHVIQSKLSTLPRPSEISEKNVST